MSLQRRPAFLKNSCKKGTQALTASGMIKQGHFDEKETCFIASDTLYSQYQETEKNARALKAEQTSSAADSTIPVDVKARPR